MTDAGHVFAATESRDPRLPTSFAVSVAFAMTLIAATGLSATGERSHVGASVAVMMAVVAAASWLCRPRGAVITGLLGWLMLDGFVIDQYGVLQWHGIADVQRLTAMVVVALATSLLRSLHLALSRRVVIESIDEPGRRRFASVPAPRAARKTQQSRVHHSVS